MQSSASCLQGSISRSMAFNKAGTGAYFQFWVDQRLASLDRLDQIIRINLSYRRLLKESHYHTAFNACASQTVNILEASAIWCDVNRGESNSSVDLSLFCCHLA